MATYHTSLLTAQDCRGHTHLIIGSNPLAAARATSSLAAGARPILIAPAPADPAAQPLHYGLQKLLDGPEPPLRWVRRAFEASDLEALGRDEVGGVADAVFVTSARDPAAAEVSRLCRRLRVPVNVADSPALCTFSLLSVHADGPLQIGVTTNGRGCKLASRIRREVAASLPAGLGAACARLGDVRRKIQAEDRGRAAQQQSIGKPAEATAAAAATAGADVAGSKPVSDAVEADEGVDDSIDQTAAFNKLVTEADADAAKTRRARWLAQVCEYWPLKKLAALTDAEVDAVLLSYQNQVQNQAQTHTTNYPNANLPPTTTTNLGRIILAGSGPGHPDLLTRATYKALQAADLVLADKLVPAGVLELAPRRALVAIARKFPGNADAAQDELLEQALAGVRAGQTVVRLKQGDPFVYGRGGEEAAFFAARGLASRVLVLPGITSSLAAPLFAGVPATQRDVADQVLVCTGTGKKGKPPAPPEFVASRTVVFLMALHRIAGLVGELTGWTAEEQEEFRVLEEDGVAEDQADEDEATRKERARKAEDLRLYGRRRLWPRNTPCAVIERASCPDQRVIRTTLDFVVQAIEQEGSRPPGLLVVGKACEVLYTPERGRSWVVEDGFKGLDLDELVPAGLAALA